ncbi:MAG TPA: bifunctional methylenetetrahydrofolate dehydrogenase/methenyltetrahydrofolate cyclohydrolase FolD [Gemmatimonadales bacterium]|jgi:methylenetetrahydrofolate dehydrogenase (NADP+)/methenyltetrahydrofolate cyclohydrolase|nr:bifunctional methylenetetrahydrofolate dehydrogenase/methenyltetrahydrofolate cyclohydrolase FolD [Gemmatimonadales bacterium]
MSARILDGAALAKTLRAEMAEQVRALTARGRRPGLAAVLVGEDPASQFYVKSKGKACEEAGMLSRTVLLPATTPEAELLDLIDRLNGDPEIHGILVQLPLPRHIDTERVLLRVSPAKDVDGFHPINVGKLVLGDPTAFRPATPWGIIQMLIRERVETRGAHAVVIGRSTIVGRPMANLLLQDAPGGNATVTICHSKTRDLPAITRTADILIAAIGRPEFVTAEMVKPGAVVIDVGINRVDDPSKPKGYRVVGDVAFGPVSEIASAITPVPGGVGPMTIAMVLKNTLQAAEMATA